MSEAVNGGKNEYKSESKSGALELLPIGEAADQTSQFSQSGISALGLRGVVPSACDVI